MKSFWSWYSVVNKANFRNLWSQGVSVRSHKQWESTFWKDEIGPHSVMTLHSLIKNREFYSNKFLLSLPRNRPSRRSVKKSDFLIFFFGPPVSSVPWKQNLPEHFQENFITLRRIQNIADHCWLKGAYEVPSPIPAENYHKITLKRKFLWHLQQINLSTAVPKVSYSRGSKAQSLHVGVVSEQGPGEIQTTMVYKYT